MFAKLVGRVAIRLALVLAGAYLAMRFLYPWFEPAVFLYDVRGIDVSRHQGIIDWDGLKSDGVQFAYIKATEGENFNDPRFSRNWYAASQAGILRGAYHFFTRCRPGKAQAENFIRVVPKDAGALVPAVDVEHTGPCRDTPPVKDIAAELEVFLAAITAHFGQRPIIYTTPEFHDAYLAGKFPKDRFWIRSLVLPPRVRKDQWLFWQYHNRGLRSGVEGPVDLDAFRGTPQQLSALRLR